MRLVVILFLAAVLSWAPLLLAQPVFVEHPAAQRPQPQVAEPTPQVAEFINQLADESPSARQSAARRLLEMGPAVEPQLRGALRHETPLTNFPFIYDQHNGASVQLVPAALTSQFRVNELDALISHLDEQRFRNGSLITLHYRHAPILDVLRDFSLQADADIEVGSWYDLSPFDRFATNRVTLDINRETYWAALRALQGATGLAPTYMNGQNRLVLTGFSPVQVTHPPSAPPHCVVAGPFQITPTAVASRRVRNYDSGAKSAILALTLLAQVEPRLGDLGRRALLHVTRCVDDRGQSLLLETNTFPSPEANVGGSWTLTADLAEPRPGRRIKSFEGELSVAIGPAQRYLVITNLLLAAGQSREFDGMKISIEKAARVDDQRYELLMSLSAPENSPYAVNFTEGDEPNVGLWDESRQTLSRRDNIYIGYEGRSHANGRDVWRWRIASNRPPAILTWLTPAQTRWLAAPFELRDLPVP